jgi:hypothetical protein
LEERGRRRPEFQSKQNRLCCYDAAMTKRRKQPKASLGKNPHGEDNSPPGSKKANQNNGKKGQGGENSPRRKAGSKSTKLEGLSSWIESNIKLPDVVAEPGPITLAPYCGKSPTPLAIRRSSG